MRKLGYYAETTEHRNGRFRKDLFDVFDGIAFKSGEPIIFFQSYDKSQIKRHEWINASLPIIKDLLSTGNKVEHHILTIRVKKKRKYRSMERVEIK